MDIVEKGRVGTVIAIFVIVTVFTIKACNADIKRQNADFWQCVQDGHKEYECRAMLRGRNVPSVIIIPR